MNSAFKFLGKRELAEIIVYGAILLIMIVILLA
jgi:hypothetical protein